MNVLRAEGIVKRYGKKFAVRGVSIEAHEGEVVGLLGPNGAGKTTLFHVIVGFLQPNEGRVFLNGEDVTPLPMYMRARMGITYLPQEPSVFGDLTVYENLKLAAEVIERWKGEEVDVEGVMELFRLKDLSQSKAGSLSGGERRRLEIARSFLIKPKFILLDEPFAGIDPIITKSIRELVLSLKEWGIGVVLSDHNVREALGICDRAYVLSEGALLKSGTPDEVAKDRDVRATYLGEEFTLR